MYKKPFISVFSFLLVVFLALVGVASTTITVYGANLPEVTMEQANEEAIKLNKLGLLAGTGNGFALEEVPTRLQGLIMLIRMMGEEDEAKACKYTHPFTDVPAWGDRYVAWAYYKGYTKGTSATTFSSNDPITAQQYLAFTLRAMGYSNDTAYETTIADARKFGIIPPNAYGDTKAPFLRADMVHITYLALQAKEKTGNLFYAYLVSKGAIDADIAASIFNPEENDKGSGSENTETDETSNIDLDDIKDFLGIGDDEPDSGSSEQANTSQKLYSYTNTNNKKSSYTVRVAENQIIISGRESTGLKLTAYLKEIKFVAPVGGVNKDVNVEYKTIVPEGNSFYDVLDIPDLRYGNYFELIVEAFDGESAINVIEKIWVKGTPNNWYFEGPTKINSNDTLMKAADNYPIDSWNKLRHNNTEEFKSLIYRLMGEPEDNDYNTAYKVFLWLGKNITPSVSAKVDSLDVIETKKANCEGYSNLMADALAAYGIPARIVIGETIYNTSANGFASASAVNHAWVEFYDSDSGRWVICDPAYATIAPSCWFDMDKIFVANGMKIVRYK